MTRGRRPLLERTQRVSARWAVLVVCVGAGLTLIPLGVPLILAAWVAIIAHPLHIRLSRRLGGKQRAAGVMTVSFVLIALLPLLALTVSVTGRAVELVRQVMASEDGAAALKSLVSASGSGPLHPEGSDGFDLDRLLNMAQQHGATAWHALSELAGAATSLVVGTFVFVLGVYEFLINGTRAYDWLLEHAPIPRAYVHRLGNAFSETGRGLFVGLGLTALLQGGAATIGYVALGIREAFVLGALTTVASIIPTGGTGLVWIPVSAGLAMGGRPVAAVVMVAIGIFVSTADNFVRPALSRYGNLSMPSLLLLVAMLGGLTLFGPWGVALGPLMVRLALEGLEILREQGDTNGGRTLG
ncbi:MAG: AI-2E family transporter [Myxococcales bacterium]|nr:AI-2E family transporter [Myxococcales bacterium]